MTHTQWQATLRQSLAMVQRTPARALTSLDRLLARVQSEAKTSLGDWHMEQTLHVISIVQSHLEDHRRSADTILQLAHHHERQQSYHGRAFVSACAIAALEFASAGDRRAAVRALRGAERRASELRPKEKLFEKAREVVASMPGRHSDRSRRRAAL